MKPLLLLILIIFLAIACTSAPPDEATNPAKQSSTATWAIIRSITPTPTISTTETPSLTPFPTSTLPPACGTTKFGKPGTQTEEKGHSVLVEGTIVLCNDGLLFDERSLPDLKIIPLREAMFDLDSGSATIDEAADIGFDVGGTMRDFMVSAKLTMHKLPCGR